MNTLKIYRNNMERSRVHLIRVTSWRAIALLISCLLLLTACHPSNLFWAESLAEPDRKQFYVEVKLGEPAVLAWDRQEIFRRIGRIANINIEPQIGDTDPQSSNINFIPEISTAYTATIDGNNGSLTDPSGEVIVLRDYCGGTDVHGDDYAVDLDLQLPDSADFPAGNYPVVLYVHGGGWYSGGYSHFHKYMSETTKRGYVAISINYRLNDGDEIVWPGHIQDAKCAVRWIRENANELNINPNAIAAVGHSAGGHLATMLAVTHQATGTEQQTLIESFKDVGGHVGVDDSVQAVVSLAGPHHLASHYFQNENAQGVYEPFLGASPVDRDDITYAQASPIYFIDVQSAAKPYLIINSQSDNFVLPIQGCELKLALENAGGTNATMLLYPEAEHQSFIQLRGLGTFITGGTVSKTITNIFNFLDYQFITQHTPGPNYTDPIVDSANCENIVNRN